MGTTWFRFCVYCGRRARDSVVRECMAHCGVGVGERIEFGLYQSCRNIGSVPVLRWCLVEWVGRVVLFLCVLRQDFFCGDGSFSYLCCYCSP